ncbi:tyrosine phosphatase family-domain-containing protein [Aspergillus ambiguus]|uniref:tyrosine phosphatase family protein n=1 Tax=Aspergillus ambiguus TaxID=176160 RepID=UPI003CCD7CCA
MSSLSSAVYPMGDLQMAIPLAQTNPNPVYEDQTELIKSQPVGPEFNPPPNFGEVVKGVYRSGYPSDWHLPSLKKLNLRSVLTLVEESSAIPNYTHILKDNGINHFRIKVHPNKDPAIKTSQQTMNDILEILLNKANHPILVHCNKGKHRTGCVVACFRKLQGWHHDDVINEYLKYACPKSRVLDLEYIGAFDPSTLAPRARAVDASSWKPSGKYKDIQPKDADLVEYENCPASV